MVGNFKLYRIKFIGLIVGLFCINVLYSMESCADLLPDKLEYKYCKDHPLHSSKKHSSKKEFPKRWYTQYKNKQYTNNPYKTIVKIAQSSKEKADEFNKATKEMFAELQDMQKIVNSTRRYLS